jgi:hypothetical protein
LLNCCPLSFGVSAVSQAYGEWDTGVSGETIQAMTLSLLPMAQSQICRASWRNFFAAS